MIQPLLTFLAFHLLFQAFHPATEIQRVLSELAYLLPPEPHLCFSSMSTLTWASLSPTLPRAPADTGTLLRSPLCGVFADTTFPSSYTLSPMEPSCGRIPSLPRIVLFANTSISQTDTAPLVAVIKSCRCILLRTHCHSGGCLTLVACQVSLSPPHPPLPPSLPLSFHTFEPWS